MSLAAGQDAPGDIAVAAGPPTHAFLEPIYEGGVRKNRGIHIPINLGAVPERRFSVGYTASNSYLNPGFLVCIDRSCESEYESDHTANLAYVSIRQPILRAFELGLTIGGYRMSNIPDGLLVHQLAADSALTSFHREWLGEESLPVLSDAPNGRQIFSMTDLEGRRLILDPDHTYALPLRIDLTRYFEIRRTFRTLMTLNAGLHLAHPLEGGRDPASGRTALVRGLDVGMSANFLYSRHVTPNVSGTFHIQLARLRNDAHVVHPGSPVHGDDLMRSQYALTWAFRFNGAFGSRAPCSFGMSQLSNSADYDKAHYWTWDPLVFEGGNNLRGAILGANDYGVLSFGCEFRGRRYQISLVEDIGGISQFLSDDGAGTSYDPDFAVGVAVSWILGRR